MIIVVSRNINMMIFWFNESFATVVVHFGHAASKLYVLLHDFGSPMAVEVDIKVRAMITCIQLHI